MLYRKVQVAISLGKRVKICDYIETPFILGMIRPYIYVSSGLSDDQFTHVIAHENDHLKRFDHLWKTIGFLILVIHWFNPFAWVAYILLCKDIEIACDEKVIRDMGKNNATVYLHREDGTVGEIFPATEGCNNFHVNGKYYDYGTGNNAEFWELVGMEVKFGKISVKK